MLRSTTTWAALCFAGLLSGVAGAECSIQSPNLTISRYSALEESRGTLNLSIRCADADAHTRYTLAISAFGGYFDQASGDYVITAIGRADSFLKMQIQKAAPALGGSVMPTVYSGDQELSFQVVIPAGQWQANGAPKISLNFDLNPLVTGSMLQ